MKFLIASLLMVSNLALASEKLGNEAVEIAYVLTHPQVKECMKDVSLNHMISVEIEKTTARCLGCNSYKISGRELMIDIPAIDLTVIEIQGKRERGSFGQPVQTYSCEVKTVSPN